MNDNSVHMQSPKNSPALDSWRRFRRNKAAMAALAYLIILMFIAFFSDVLFDYETDIIRQNISSRLLHPSGGHPFGTDEFGRDLFARVLYGTRVSLIISFSSVLMSLLIGGTLGALSGFLGGRFENIVMRLTDILQSLPMLLFAIVIVAALGPSIVNLAIALATASIAPFARVVRSSVLTVRESEYVEAARAIGANNRVILFKHVLPNCLSPIIVQVTLRIASAIYSTSSLSFLGMGVQAPDPEWGGLLAAGRTFIRDSSYLCVIPGIAIMLAILSLNLLGDGLRDALDPRLK